MLKGQLNHAYALTPGLMIPLPLTCMIKLRSTQVMRNLNNVMMHDSNVASLLFTLQSAEARNGPNQSQSKVQYSGLKSHLCDLESEQGFLSMVVAFFTEVQQTYRKTPKSKVHSPEPVLMIKFIKLTEKKQFTGTWTFYNVNKKWKTIII